LLDLNIYTQDLYEYLILSLRASYEAVRKQSFQILLLFPNTLPFLTLPRIKLQFETALASSKNLIIKNYESSAYLMSILFARHLPMFKILIALSPTTQENDNNLEIFEFLVSYLGNSFDIFQENFLVNWEKFYSNSPHGMLTILSTMIQGLFGEDGRNPSGLILDLQTKETIQKRYLNLFSRVMRILGKIMMFATKISAENVSTSVFDNSMIKENLLKEKSFV